MPSNIVPPKLSAADLSKGSNTPKLPSANLSATNPALSQTSVAQLQAIMDELKRKNDELVRESLDKSKELASKHRIIELKDEMAAILYRTLGQKEGYAADIVGMLLDPLMGDIHRCGNGYQIIDDQQLKGYCLEQGGNIAAISHKGEGGLSPETIAALSALGKQYAEIHKAAEANGQPREGIIFYGMAGQGESSDNAGPEQLTEIARNRGEYTASVFVKAYLEAQDTDSGQEPPSLEFIGIVNCFDFPNAIPKGIAFGSSQATVIETGFTESGVSEQMVSIDPSYGMSAAMHKIFDDIVGS